MKMSSKRDARYRWTESHGVPIPVERRDLYAVLCTSSSAEGGGGGYELATRRFFFSEADAQAYRATLSPSRDPLIVKVVNPAQLWRPLCECGALLARDQTCPRCEE